MRILLLIIGFYAFTANAQVAYDPSVVADKLNPYAHQQFTQTQMINAKEQVERTIQGAQSCGRDADCANIVANCFGCTVPVHKDTVEEIYQLLAEFHTKFGQCEKACVLGAQPPKCIQNRCRNDY